MTTQPTLTRRPMWRVEVDGCSMAHGPDTGDDHPEQMAACYRDINPTATIAIIRWVFEYEEN